MGISIRFYLKTWAALIVILGVLPLVHAKLAVASSRNQKSAQPSTLVLIGGGKRPAESLQAWIRSADQNAIARRAPRARLGAIAWASGEAQETLARLREELAPLTGSTLESPPVEPSASGFSRPDLTRLLSWIQSLDGLYFTGGDQNRVIDLFVIHGEIPSSIRSRYESGNLTVAGTSAGTAIQGELVFTGDEDLTVIDPKPLHLRPGLSLLPGTVVEQHFVKRQRHNRMLSALIAHPELMGIAVDEDTALVIQPQASLPKGQVFGRGQVLLFIPVQAQNKPGPIQDPQPGTRFDLTIVPSGSCIAFAGSLTRAIRCVP